MPFIKTSLIKTEYTHVDFNPDAPTVGQQIDTMIAEAHMDGGLARLHELTFGFETDEDYHGYMRAYHEALHGGHKVNLRKRARPADDGYAMPAD